MSIADDLNSLQDLRDNGQLTEAEHASAKTKLLAQQQPPSGKVLWGFGRLTRTESLATIVGLLITAAAIGFIFAWFHGGPIQLMDEVQTVPANTWEAIPFTLPYSGSVAINVDVQHGNPMDVLVLAPDQLAKLKADDGEKALEYSDFDAQQTQAYERSSSLRQGSYYLILRDTTLGALAAKASDVAVKIQLKP